MQQHIRRTVTRLASAWPLFAMAAAMSLSACGSDNKSQVAAPAQQAKHDKVPEDPTAKMAHAVTIGTSTVSVDLKYEILNKPVTGSPIEIELAVVPKVGADSMSLAFAPSSGLTLSKDSAPNFDAVKAGQIERVKFSAQAKEATVFYVTVTTTVYTAGTSSARSFAIPLIVSAATPAVAPVAAPAAAPPHPAKKS